MPDSPRNLPSAHPHPAEKIAESRVLRSAELFAGRRVVVIEHGEEQYRLMITRNDRLLLQK